MSSAFPLPTEAAPRKRGFFVALTAGLRGPGIMVVLMTLLVTTTALAQGGPDCTSALNAPISLPFNAVGLTTCGSGNGLTSATTTLCGSALYLAGEDHLFAFTPTVTGVVEVNVTSGSSSLGLFLYEGCPAGGNCLSSSFSGSGNQDLQGLVTAGTTYFVLVDSWTTPCHPSFSLDITAPAPLPPPTTQDCFGATPVCQDIYQELNSPVGEGNYPDEIDGGISCLGGGEVDGIWYTFTVQNSGSVCFSITPNDLSDDYDWAVYDLTNATCSDIYTDPSLEVSCNFSGLPGITGANGAAGNQNEPCVNVTVGQSFALYVSNWSQSPNGYTLDFGLPNATAGIFDQSPPTLDTLLQVPCSPDQMLVVFSEFVLCSSVQASDLIVSGPGGPYVVEDIESPICATGGGQDNQYVLTLSPGITGGGVFTVELIDDVEDLCGNIGNSGLATGPLALPLSVSASAIGAGCNGQPGSVNAQANGGTAPYTYDLAGTQQVNNGLFGNLMAGSYALTVTDAFGCLVDTVLDVLQAATFLDNDTMLMSVACAGGLDGMFAVSTSG
ncbi:MAG: hypothetical protein KDB88_08570, partial [Flavobacteriales bacterium]|nr:hypothetical protein [Flavobacteriales bacterium]